MPFDMDIDAEQESSALSALASQCRGLVLHANRWKHLIKQGRSTRMERIIKMLDNHALELKCLSIEALDSSVEKRA